MKRLMFLAVLAVGGEAVAWDEYGTVAPKKTEVDLMATYNLSPSAGGFTPSVQVKYGLWQGFDAELTLSAPTDPSFGVDRPNLAVKYIQPSTGIGGFVAFDLPLASKKINPDPQTGVTVALQCLKTFDQIVLNDWLYYASTYQTGDNGTMDIYLKPQYNVTDKVGPYLGVEYSTSGKFTGYKLVVRPGINYVLNDKYSLEANLPLTKAKGSDLATSIYLGAYGVF